MPTLYRLTSLFRSLATVFFILLKSWLPFYRVLFLIVFYFNRRNTFRDNFRKLFHDLVVSKETTV